MAHPGLGGPIPQELLPCTVALLPMAGSTTVCSLAGAGREGAGVSAGRFCLGAKERAQQGPPSSPCRGSHVTQALVMAGWFLSQDAAPQAASPDAWARAHSQPSLPQGQHEPLCSRASIVLAPQLLFPAPACTSHCVQSRCAPAGTCLVARPGRAARCSGRWCAVVSALKPLQPLSRDAGPSRLEPSFPRSPLRARTPSRLSLLPLHSSRGFLGLVSSARHCCMELGVMVTHAPSALAPSREVTQC